MDNYHQTIQIVRPGDVQHRVNELRHRSDDVKSRVVLTLKHLWNPERQLLPVRSNCSFQNLREGFPQFSEVIDHLENITISMGRLGLPFEMPPILLMGEPGLGKTYFVSEVAKLFRLPFKDISMATRTSSFDLAGGSLQWGEGTVGDLAKFMAESTVANPIVLLDELDKVSSSARFNAINVLYGWLEPHSARRFRDEALEIDMDVSRVIWIGTGNYIHNIPEPILSRLRIFDISLPPPLMMRQVVKSIYESFRRAKSYGQLLNTVLKEEVIEVLSHHSPRSIRLLIEEGAFKVIRDHRDQLSLSDIPNRKKERRHVGFI